VSNPELAPAIFNDSDSFSEAVEKFISAKTNEGRRSGKVSTSPY
jgi:hypothetical protein